jgi:cation diffusion facilitator CzcD-associated flavoprotein CzcO
MAPSGDRSARAAQLPAVRQHNVSIIGGGIAGVATARAMRARGLRCTLFERKARIGGLWVDAYPGATVQATKEQYDLPELRLPASAPEHLSAADVLAYLDKYARVFDLYSCMRLQTTVVRVERLRGADATNGSAPAFEITFQGPAGQPETETCTHVVICNGLTSAAPDVPAVPGADAFAGKLMHSSQWRSTADLAGARVLVGGGGKSAMDASLAAAAVAQRTVQAVRTAHWYIPLHIGRVLPFRFALFNRAQLRGCCRSLLASGTPLRTAPRTPPPRRGVR